MDSNKQSLLSTKHNRKYMVIDNKFVLRGKSYTMDIPNRLVKYFDIEALEKNADWTISAVSCPTIEGFYTRNKIQKNTYYRWVRDYPEMKEAHEWAKAKQKEILIVNGLNWKYNAPMAKFMLGVEHDMVEKREIVNSWVEINDEQKRKMIAEYILDMKLKEMNVIEGTVIEDISDKESL